MNSRTGGIEQFSWAVRIPAADRQIETPAVVVMAGDCSRGSVTHRPHGPAPEISDTLLAELRDDLLSRRIVRGLRKLDSCSALVEGWDPLRKNAAPFLSCLAQWVELGFGRRDPELVGRLHASFGREARCRLPLADYVHVRLVDGMLGMTGDPRSALVHFDAVLALAADLNEWGPLLTAHYWKTRCLRRLGEYEDALAHLMKARELAIEHRQGTMAAVVRLLESSVHLRKERLKEATVALEEAQPVLAATDDYVALGTIESTHGRILRRQGRLGEALQRFEWSVEHFEKVEPAYPKLAHALVNLASTQRLIAVQVRRKLDSDAAERRKTSAPPAASRQPLREKLHQLQEDALSNLNRAWRIFDCEGNDRGRAAVRLNRGFLCLDREQLDCAAQDGAAAFTYSQNTQDFVMMARSRTLQCIVENARVEGGMDDLVDPGRHAQAAHDYARDALELSSRAQDRRTLGHAYTWYGLTLANDFFNARESAQEALNQAEAYIDPEPFPQRAGDPVWEDLQTLKSRLLKRGDMNALLLQWSNGQVGRKKFRQLEQEFAEMVIPRVWELEGRKVSRVATRLSISRNKVRQVLGRLGLQHDD